MEGRRSHRASQATSSSRSQRQSEITVAESEGAPPRQQLFDAYDVPRSTSQYSTSATGNGGHYPYVQHLDQKNSILWAGGGYPADSGVHANGYGNQDNQGYVEMADLHGLKDQGPSPTPTPVRASQVEAWLVPDIRSKHSAYVSCTLVLAVLFVFAFMAGQYGLYQISPLGLKLNSSSSNSSSIPDLDWGPRNFLSWLAFWTGNQKQIFDFGYLFVWGARYAPAIAAGQWWRIFSSIMIHSGTVHVMSNSLLWVVLAVPLERTYGPVRVLLISIASGLGGTFLSMAFEDPCTLYVGASGAVFGFLGLYVTDIVLNFETLHMPWLRLLLMLICLGFMIAMEYIETPLSVKRVSHLSHVGGLIAGLFVSFLFLPNLKDRRWRKMSKIKRRLDAVLHLPEEGEANMANRSCWTRNRWLYILAWLVCALVAIFFLVVLPLYIWKSKLPGLSCPELGIENLY